MTPLFLLIALTHQGYWLAGQDAVVTVGWADAVQDDGAVWRWELDYGEIPLLQGESKLAKDKPMELNITAPKVRARTAMTLKWELISSGTREPIETGERVIHVFPHDPMKTAVRRLDDRSIAVWSKDPSLHEAMEAAGLTVRAVRNAGSLATVEADLIVVGPDTLGENALLSQALVEHAEAGATVIVFRHSDRKTLLGLQVVQRQLSAPPECSIDHPLLTGLTRSDLHSLGGEGMHLLRTQREKHTTPVIFEKEKESAIEKNQSIDSLYLVRSAGKGRMIYCQLPLDNWLTDPRSRQILSNALEYVLVPGGHADNDKRMTSMMQRTQTLRR